MSVVLLPPSGYEPDGQEVIDLAVVAKAAGELWGLLRKSDEVAAALERLAEAGMEDAAYALDGFRPSARETDMGGLRWLAEAFLAIVEGHAPGRLEVLR